MDAAMGIKKFRSWRKRVTKNTRQIERLRRREEIELDEGNVTGRKFQSWMEFFS
jgi:hypothetical protein